ncbi:hypothetical protein [Dysgonomonas sp. BGC7]|uniref:hypothetical protein n=1 Tax=Dysgonomonas sp. BGC7 TaxID=1658008 RepID=UPI0006811037|nr:hypothetical protein [Dysgonomonas sp. BGC7]MBD8387881.1 hypothetical protein [Dysgonomonas sp. BGC7]
MKKLILALSLIFAIGLVNPVSAQNININVNLDKQPAWGPVGYDYAEYYYFPDINVYFDINNSLFYYQSGSNWISNRYLPDKYSKYDLYSLYKVVVNNNQPWQQNKTHKKSYSMYKGNKTQEAIRYSNNSKYNTSKNNSNSWVDNDNFGNKNNKKNNAKENSSSKNKVSTDNNRAKQSKGNNTRR